MILVTLPEAGQRRRLFRPDTTDTEAEKWELCEQNFKFLRKWQFGMTDLSMQVRLGLGFAGLIIYVKELGCKAQ